MCRPTAASVALLFIIPFPMLSPLTMPASSSDVKSIPNSANSRELSVIFWSWMKIFMKPTSRSKRSPIV